MADAAFLMDRERLQDGMTFTALRKWLVAHVYDGANGQYGYAQKYHNT